MGLVVIQVYPDTQVTLAILVFLDIPVTLEFPVTRDIVVRVVTQE